MNRFEIVLKKFRALFGGSPMTMEKFLQISRLQFDKDNFFYYLERIPKSEGGDVYHGNVFYKLEASAVWEAEKRKDLAGLLNAIVDHIEWENPSFYGLGLHYEEIRKRERRL